MLQWDLNQLYCSCEPSTLEGLVRGFISTPLSFVKRLSSVDWPSWRSERHGCTFPRFSLRKNFCLDHSCFGSCFDLFVLGSTLRLDFCPGKEQEAPSSAVCFQEKPTQTSGHFWKVNFSFGFCIFELTFPFSLNMSPDVCLASSQIGADTGVPSHE